MSSFVGSGSGLCVCHVASTHVDQTHPHPPLAQHFLFYRVLSSSEHQLLDTPWILDLLPDMEISWPDLLKPASSGFWKYEWYKHGTCAAKAPALNSQHKYFSKALELYHKVDLDSMLRKFDIIPSAKYYKFSQIEGVIENFYGVTPKIQCVHPAENPDVQVLGQLEICFSPDFSLLDCEKEISSPGGSAFSVCDPDVLVYYPPL
ncbi:ribonuclease T2 isoform X2 [Hippocampus zosterae]|uniref:ribonuclease T2 isoform X2 n=1 Tax=Hippocampus zosterae TaxID=109293 RepID=UPI00223CD45C|nr:ribonuclease T2 isoform X2 [Hippocampus zosterae]XP_051919502.1 ribonuclease T2 isoform X2 [Hippocampus zosterae]XP_051919504.1 ribonuclease T2 isoform X2 [Hippocampus zosterae]